ncbi:hypothetical protein DY000_02000632 [Brassica cretica]|uniref:Uncharacterized protein n=1 Tax=Brassica cretica TaxID=69181 RepID=A0ABQ7BTJ4_BRACR|nr:hypothetical protein DY000_02000632 [Brassica cretica]
MRGHEKEVAHDSNGGSEGLGQTKAGTNPTIYAKNLGDQLALVQTRFEAIKREEDE